MYIEPVTVGREMELLKKKFSEALESSGYTAEERKILSDAINSVEYIKGFFAGTSVLPPLHERAETTWGMTFKWLRGAFKNIEKAEDLLDEGLANELALTPGGNLSENTENHMEDFGRNETESTCYIQKQSGHNDESESQVEAYDDEEDDAMWYGLGM